MYTLQEIAEQIELTKPDFSEFLTLVNNRNDSMLIEHVRNTYDIPSKVLKAEILSMMNRTHNNGSHWSFRKDCEQIITGNIVNCKSFNLGNHYNSPSNYYIEKNFDPEYHILAHIKNPKPYLPSYLWNKVRAKKINTTSPKQLQPNDMSLHIFKTYLQNSKKQLTSTQVEEYLAQLKDNSFNSIREDFMDVLFSKCTKPSIELQKRFSGQVYNGRTPILPNQDDAVLYKYMTLSRYRVKNLANRLQVPVSQSIFDTLDSAYKPFITGIYRTPDTNINELSYLFSTLILFQISVLKEPNPVYSYFIECLTKHLQAPESASIVQELKQQYSLFTQAVAQLQL